MQERVSLHSILQHITDGLTCVDRDYTISYVNHSIERWFSTRSSLEGKRCYQVYFHRREPCIECPLLSPTKDEKKREEISVLPLHNSLQLELSCYPLWDSERREGVGGVNLVKEIGERERRVPLSGNEKDLFLILQSIGDGVISTDREGTIQRMNPQAKKLTGWSSEAVGRRTREVFFIFHPLTYEPIRDPVEYVLDTERTLHRVNHITLRSRDGTERPITFHASPMLDREGEFHGVILIFTDHTVMLKTEQALPTSEEEKTLILNSISETCVLYDINKRIVWMNKKAEELAGRDAKELIGSYCYSTWFGRDSICEGCPMEKVLEEGESNEGEVVTPAGKILLIKGYPVFEGTEIAGFIELGMDITQKKKTESLLQETMYKLERLHETALTMGRITKEEELFELMVEAARKVLRFSFCTLYRKEGNHLVVRAKTQGSPSQTIDLSKESHASLFGQSETLFIPDLSKEEGFLDHLSGFTSLISVPIGDRGIFQVLSRRGVVFSKEDRKLVEILTSHAREALKSIHFGSRLEHMSIHDNLTGLYSRNYLEQELESLDTEISLPISVIILDINGLKLVNDTYGYGKGDTILVAVAQDLKRSCRSNDIVTRWGGDEFLIFLPKTARDACQIIRNPILEGFQEMVVEKIPIQIASGTATKEEPGEDLFRTFQRAEDLMNKQKLTVVSSARGKIISTLLKTLGEKSHETEEHAWRMQRMAIEIGAEIGLPPSELDRLSLLLTLHDIGKIAIAEEILTKPGRLSNEEWEIIKTHPEVGARIASSTDEFAHVANDILAHHERWDGGGYPRGLREEEIPILARVTSIVDSFDVMTHERSYKAAMSSREAIDELKRCAGTQFDPELVDVFIRLITS